MRILIDALSAPADAGGMRRYAEEVVTAIAALKAQGVSMIISEQALNTIRRCADRVYVVDRGMTVWTGTVDGFYADPDIARKYLMVS